MCFLKRVFIVCSRGGQRQLWGTGDLLACMALGLNSVFSLGSKHLSCWPLFGFAFEKGFHCGAQAELQV